MTMLQAIGSAMRKGLQFEGRATRAEFWKFLLFLAIIGTVIDNYILWSNGGNTFKLISFSALHLHTHISWIENLYSAIFGLPFLALISRRLHDTGRSASQIIIGGFITLVVVVFGVKALIGTNYQSYANWMLFLPIVFFACYFLYLLALPSQYGTNKYGPNPHEVSQ